MLKSVYIYMLYYMVIPPDLPRSILYGNKVGHNTFIGNHWSRSWGVSI